MDKISVWAGSFTGSLSFLLDFVDAVQSTSPDTAFFFYNQLVHQIGKRVEVARGLEFLDQHNAKKLREDFDGHRDDVVCTVIADIEKEVSVRGTDARLAVSGLSTCFRCLGVRGGGTENRLFSRGAVMR